MLARGGKLAQTSPQPLHPSLSEIRMSRAGRVGMVPNAMIGDTPPLALIGKRSTSAIDMECRKPKFHRAGSAKRSEARTSAAAEPSACASAAELPSSRNGGLAPGTVPGADCITPPPMPARNRCVRAPNFGNRTGAGPNPVPINQFGACSREAHSGTAGSGPNTPAGGVAGGASIPAACDDTGIRPAPRNGCSDRHGAPVSRFGAPASRVFSSHSSVGRDGIRRRSHAVSFPARPRAAGWRTGFNRAQPFRRTTSRHASAMAMLSRPNFLIR